MTARNSADDYASAIRAHLPRGRVWPLDPDAGQSQVIACYAPVLERLDGEAIALIEDIFPASAAGLLAEWEETLGLPDPCLGPNPTLLQLRDQVVARFVGAGGQSKQRFIDYAATLGFVVTVTEYAPFRAGRSRAGDRCCGTPWANAWLVTIVSDAISADHAAFRAGQSRAGDPLASTAAGHDALLCELKKIAPAQSALLFTF